jgi:hypothetical protein
MFVSGSEGGWFQSNHPCMTNFILNTLFFIGIVVLLWLFVIVMLGFMSCMVVRLLIDEVKHEKMG